MCCSTITIQHRIQLSVFVTDLGLVLSEPANANVASLYSNTVV